MKYLLKLEWLKVKNHTPFWVFLGLFAFANFASIIITHMIQNNGNMITDMLMNSTAMTFPKFWHTSGWVCSWSLFLLGIYVITNVSNEISFKTHRQNIIDGTSRIAFLHGKWLMVLGLSIFATVVYIIGTLLYIAIFQTSSFGKIFESEYWFIGYYFVETLLNLSLAMFLAMILRKTGLSVVIYIVYVWVLDNILFLWFSNLHAGSGRFFLIEAGDSMVNYPFFDPSELGGAGTNEDNDINIFGPVTPKLRLILCGLSLFYISIYYFVTKWQFKKTDL